MEVLLHAPDWQSIGNDTHYWRGYAWLNGQPWTPDAYAGEELSTLLSQLNGCFSWIGKRGDQLFAATDRLGSYPLFYGKGIVTDRLAPDQLKINWKWLKMRLWHFVEALPGNCTLDDEFFSISPHSYLVFSAGEVEEVRLQGSNTVQKEQCSTLSHPDAVFQASVINSCQRLIDFAKGETIVVLLSDGYDSRLILAALKQLNYPKIVAATYGIAGNGVVERAREIASRLKVPFHFIDYADPAHAQLMLTAYPELVSVAANGQSVPQEQEIFAAYQLRQLVPADSILVPGISGDLQAGSYVPPYSFRLSYNRRAPALKRWLRTRLTRLPAAAAVTARWEEHIQLADHKESELAAVHATEAIIVQERLNKYLCTTLRAYELAGFSWYLPLWDKEFVEFWQRQPITSRRYRADYRQWCKSLFFKPLQIHFSGEGEKPKIHLGRIIRRFLPFGNHLVEGVPDPNEFSKTIAPLIGKEVPPTEVNAALGDWLINYYGTCGHS